MGTRPSEKHKKETLVNSCRKEDSLRVWEACERPVAGEKRPGP